MQPALLPAALAIATFFQSSEAGNGREGRDRAVRLRDVAQGHLEASLNAQWIDDSLAQAAWVSSYICNVVYVFMCSDRLLASGILRDLSPSSTHQRAGLVVDTHA
jgi:hypothetical protein